MKCDQFVVVLAALFASPPPVVALLADAALVPADVAPEAAGGPAAHHRGHHHGGSAGGSSIAPRAVQEEVEQMALRADLLAKSDEAAAQEVVSGLADVEAALETRAGSDAALASEIRATRGALCAKQGFRSHERADCEVFMRRACIPGEAAQERHPEQTQPAAKLLPVEVCRHFFLEETP